MVPLVNALPLVVEFLTWSTVDNLVPKDLSLVLSFAPWSLVGVHSGQHCPASTTHASKILPINYVAQWSSTRPHLPSRHISWHSAAGASGLQRSTCPVSQLGHRTSALPASPGADFRITLVHLTGFRCPALAPPESRHS